MPDSRDRVEKGSSGFIPSLEMSRGFAALMVALFHCGQAGYIDAGGQQVQLAVAASNPPSFAMGGIALRILGNGHGAVIFFFVLSGFVLTMMLHRETQPTGPAAQRFAIGRIFRIYPAIISTLVIFAAVFVLTGRATAPPESFSASNLFLNALLVRSNVNGVMWSLQLEMIAVPLIFLGFVLCRRWGIGALVALTVLFIALSFAKYWKYILGPGLDMAGLYSFLAGAIAFHKGQWLIARSGAAATLIVGVAGFLLARPLLGWWSNWSILFETIFGSLIVAALAFGHWRTRRWLSPFRFIGRVSYSFYLLHALTLVVVWQMPGQLGSAVAAGWSPLLLAFALFAASSAAIMPIAWLQHRWVELPGIALGHHVLAGMGLKTYRERMEIAAPPRR